MSRTPRIAFALLGTLAGTTAATAAYTPEPDLERYAEPLTIAATTVGSAGGIQSDDPSELALDTSSVYVSAPLASDGPMTVPTAGIPEGPDWPVNKDGVYIVGYLVGAMIDGDFDSATLVDDIIITQTFYLDEIDPGVGFGFGIGYRLGDWAFEMSYQRTYHDHEFNGTGISGEAVLNTVNFDLKWYFMTDTPLQPFVMVGGLFPWLEEPLGSENTSGMTSTFGDATFRGLGFNVGGGVNFYLTPEVALVAAAGYRYMFFSDAKSHDQGTFGLDGNQDASGFFAYGGVSFTF